MEEALHYLNQAVVQEGLALPTPQMHSWILLAHPCYTGEEAGVQGGWVIVTSHSHRPEDQRLNVPPLRPFYIWLLFTLGQIIRSLWLRFVLPASWTWTQTDLSKVGIYWLINCGVGEDSWESLGLQGDPTSPFWRRSALGFLWKDWCESWNSSTLATSCEELTHWKRLWCWEGLGAGWEGDDRGWDGWMASLTWWTWVWVDSGSWWWTGRPGVLWFMGSQRVGHDWVTELNWNVMNDIFFNIKKKIMYRKYRFTQILRKMIPIFSIMNWLFETRKEAFIYCIIFGCKTQPRNVLRLMYLKVIHCN